MGEGLKIVNDILKRSQEQQSEIYSRGVFLGIGTTLVVLSDPRNGDLLERLIAYCKP